MRGTFQMAQTTGEAFATSVYCETDQDLSAEVLTIPSLRRSSSGRDTEWEGFQKGSLLGMPGRTPKII